MSSLGPLNRYLVSASGKVILIFASAQGKILVSGVYFLLGSYFSVKRKPWRNLQVLLDKHFYFLPIKHVCAFGHHDWHCLTSTLCLSMFLKRLKNMSDGQKDQHCAKLQMFAKQCLFFWRGLWCATWNQFLSSKLKTSSTCVLFFRPVWELTNYLGKLNCVSVLKS